MKSSHTTGHWSSMPNCLASKALSASVVTGVMRSTIELGNATDVRSHSASSASDSSAYEANISFARSPLPGRLSHDMTVKGTRPSARRRRSPSTTMPKTVCGGRPPSASRSTARLPLSNSPVTGSTL